MQRQRAGVGGTLLVASTSSAGAFCMCHSAHCSFASSSARASVVRIVALSPCAWLMTARFRSPSITDLSGRRAPTSTFCFSSHSRSIVSKSSPTVSTQGSRNPYLSYSCS